MTYYLSADGTKFTKISVKSVQDALLRAHAEALDLYEDDEDGPEMVYSHRWSPLLQREVWVTLRKIEGKPTFRRHLPDELNNHRNRRTGTAAVCPSS